MAKKPIAIIHFYYLLRLGRIMIYDLVISGRIVSSERIHEGSIGIKGRTIEKIAEEKLNGKKEISLPDTSFIFPGFIDCHVHLREDASGKWNYKEDFLTGSKAAIHGGVTTVADMPNTPEPAINKERILEKIKLAKKSKIGILFYGGVVSENLDKLKEMADLVCGYKIYVAETTGKLLLKKENLGDALRIISETGKPVVFHCSVDDLKEILELCKKHNAKTHIAHVSKKEEIEIITRYKDKMQLTCEATPHHLYFSEKDFEKNNLLRVKPELGSEEDKEALMDALKRGTIDILATDHAPHTLEDKKQGASGLPELDAYGNFVSWLLNKMKAEQIAQLIKNAADFLEINDIGQIKENYIANLTVLNSEETKIENKNLYTKCGWSPFEGLTFPGKVIYTIHHGKIMMKDGKILV